MSVPFRLQSKTKKFLKVYTRLTRAQEELKRSAFAFSLNYQQHLCWKSRIFLNSFAIKQKCNRTLEAGYMKMEFMLEEIPFSGFQLDLTGCQQVPTTDMCQPCVQSTSQNGEVGGG